ncbi:hypothetical protein K1719_046992 [Acacia pycnantha]|nr:hypothetical protein K1719_046992 [Acacia pycnantha]
MSRQKLPPPETREDHRYKQKPRGRRSKEDVEDGDQRRAGAGEEGRFGECLPDGTFLRNSSLSTAPSYLWASDCPFATPAHPVSASIYSSPFCCVVKHSQQDTPTFSWVLRSSLCSVSAKPYRDQVPFFRLALSGGVIGFCHIPRA